MTKERPPSISQETLAEVFDQINDKLENIADKLDYLVDHLPPHSDHYDFPVNDD